MLKNNRHWRLSVRCWRDLLKTITTELKTVAIAPLNGTNYPTWKVQWQMALVHDGLWVIVNGTETAQDKGEADRHSNFLARWDHALTCRDHIKSLSVWVGSLTWLTCAITRRDGEYSMSTCWKSFKFIGQLSQAICWWCWMWEWWNAIVAGKYPTRSTYDWRTPNWGTGSTVQQILKEFNQVLQNQPR